MMNEHALKWAEALESGEFEQTAGVLTRIEDGKQKHCCLGVLCVLAIRDGVQVTTSWSQAPFSTTEMIQLYDDQQQMPPRSVKQWLGYPFLEAEVYANMNDSGRSFAAIAARIRKDFKLPES